MKEHRYKVIFAGKIRPDCDAKSVKSNLINSLNINDGDVEKLFSGRRIVVQKSIDHKKALSIKERFENAGALCEIVPIQTNDSKDEAQKSRMMYCPKCGLEQKVGLECIGCGIVFSKYKELKEKEKKQETTDISKSAVSEPRQAKNQAGRSGAPLAVAGDSRAQTKSISKRFYVGSMVVGFGFADFFIVGAGIEAIRGNASAAFYGLKAVQPVLIYLTIVVAVLLHKTWSAIQDEHARTTPGKAVGFLFIPFFNFYWAFQAFWGLAKDFNLYIERYHIRAKPLPEWLFLTFIVFALNAWIPTFGLVLQAANYFIVVAITWKLCNAVNSLAYGEVNEDESSAPAQALRQQIPGIDSSSVGL